MVINMIEVVESISIAQYQPLLGENYPLFEWRPGIPFDNETLTEVDLDDTDDVNCYESLHTHGEINPLHDSDVDNEEVEYIEDEADFVDTVEHYPESIAVDTQDSGDASSNDNESAQLSDDKSSQ